MYYNTGIFNEEKPGKQFDLKLLSMLIPFAGKYRHLLFFAVILVVIITFCDLSLPYVTKIAIDRYIVHRIDPVLLEASFRGDDLKGVAWMSLIIVGISCVGFVFNFIQLMIMEYTGQMIMHDLRLKIF
ncbi:MAG: hypothetical protein JRF40_07685, partial [Deltaproteobacteria bacterium]|nr:hypothetical protein [Deltaproteobacteria bacterium]